jgi:regulator of ribonuclease activity A
VSFTTADLCDRHEAGVRVVAPRFRDYGGLQSFSGPIATVKVHEDNSLVRPALEKPGEGRVLVVDGGGSRRYALVGDVLAGLAHRNGWAGLLVYGYIRDSEAIARVAIGVKALGTHPRKSVKNGAGDRDIPVTFSGVDLCARGSPLCRSRRHRSSERPAGSMPARAHAPTESRRP